MADDAPIRIVLDQPGDPWTLYYQYEWNTPGGSLVYLPNAPGEPEADTPHIVEGK